MTRNAKSSFPVSFWVLPRAKRHAMQVLYAFFRLTDDLADQPGELPSKKQALQQWRTDLEAAFTGEFRHPCLAALAEVVRTFAVPVRHLHEVIDGVEMDLEPVRLGSFFELYRYCYRVASAVGLSCLPVWGFRPGLALADAQEPAEAAGIAFQLTNILRDLGEDLRNARVYLPEDELQRFNMPPEAWQDPAKTQQFHEMMRFQADRARLYYQKSEPLAGLLSPEGRAIFCTMRGLYFQLLQEIESRNFDVFRERVRVKRRTKIRLLLRAWPIRWGWL